MIACTHPGRNGDALFSLPTIKALSKKHSCNVDFYTSSWCRPLEKLFRYQSFINDFIVPENYVIREHSIGVQPWNMPVPPKYDAVYQLGFRNYPITPIPDHISLSQGLGHLPLELEYPLERTAKEPRYFVGCPKTMEATEKFFIGFENFFKSIGNIIPIHFEVMDPIELASLLHFSLGFIGSPSLRHTIACFIPNLKMVALRPAWLDERQMYHSSKQIIFHPPNLSVTMAIDFLGI